MILLIDDSYFININLFVFVDFYRFITNLIIIMIIALRRYRRFCSFMVLRHL